MSVLADWRLTADWPQDIFCDFPKRIICRSFLSWLCNLLFWYEFCNFLSLLDKKLKCFLSSENRVFYHFFLTFLLAEIKLVIFVGKWCIDALLLRICEVEVQAAF